MIAWKYIDKPSATISAIRDYGNMRNVINITPEEIKELYSRMINPRNAKVTGLPKAKKPHGHDDMLANSLDKLDVMQERYRQAIEFMGWFEPAWASLADDEQLVLREFYMSGSQHSGACVRLQAKLSYSERQVYRIKERAMKRMTHMLFGK